MSAYPIMFNLTARSCVVVGGGTVAVRKVIGLLEGGAKVTVISPILHPKLQAYASDGTIHWVQASYQINMLNKFAPFLVFAATDDARVNQQVKQEAHALHALVNAVDDPTGSDFSNMATIQRAPITVGLHTGSTSPALARHLKEKITAVIGPEYAILASWLGELRSHLRQIIPDQPNRHYFYEAVLDSDILSLLHQGAVDSARQRLDDLLQEWS